MKMQNLIGKKVKKIFMNEELLRFETDGGNLTFTVEGDCCSHSYFYDFYGVKKLLDGSAIKSIEEVEVEDDGKRRPENDELRFYGYRFVVDDPDFGEVTAVMSFRNDSNGYYGGRLQETEDREITPEIKDDVIGS